MRYAKQPDTDLYKYKLVIGISLLTIKVLIVTIEAQFAIASTTVQKPERTTCV